MIILPNLINAATEVAAEVASEAGKESGGVLAMLGINWKLFIAQLVNFTVIVFILWKWVFGPVTTALQSRTKKIEESIKDSEKIKQQVADLEVFKKEQQTNARREYEEVVSRADAVADKQKQEILAEARSQAEKMVKDAEVRIQSDKKQMLEEVKSELGSLVIAATEKVISAKLDPAKDAKLIKESLSEIK